MCSTAVKTTAQGQPVAIAMTMMLLPLLSILTWVAAKPVMTSAQTTVYLPWSHRVILVVITVWAAATRIHWQVKSMPVKLILKTRAQPAGYNVAQVVTPVAAGWKKTVTASVMMKPILQPLPILMEIILTVVPMRITRLPMMTALLSGTGKKVVL